MGRRNREMQRARRSPTARDGIAPRPSYPYRRGQRRTARPPRSAADFVIDFVAILGLGLAFVTLLQQVGVRNYVLAVVLGLVAAKLIVSFVRQKFF